MWLHFNIISETGLISNNAMLRSFEHWIHQCSKLMMKQTCSWKKPIQSLQQKNKGLE